MRILSLAVCAAVVVCDNYAWAATATPDDLVLKTDELADLVSEINFRAELVNSLNKEFEASTIVDCAVIKTTLATLLQTIINTAKVGTTIPFIGSAFQFLVTQLEMLAKVPAGGSNLSTAVIFGLDFAFSTLKTITSTISLVPLPIDFTPIVKAIQDTKSIIRTAVMCALGGSKVEFTQGHCDATADLYRFLVEDASKQSPVMPETASEEWKRIAAGSLSVLELSKNAIAKTNKGLLSTRPIFTPDLLSQYRDEFMRVAETDKAKIYVQTYLGAIVGVSNALEACLRVAADPVAAVEELQDVLNAQARFEDENEDDDEDQE
ncbi:hypothetical protein BGX33_006085 [Mortierella sp. NVP41]|nr:hypothetical protein BGX33_006085 [Mortierella sp. NVP41]